MLTCYVAALGITADIAHKLVLRIMGCLFGAAMGVAAIFLVIPHLDFIGGLMAMILAGALVAGWVSAGNERVSYAGVLVGLTFLLTIITGFGPSTDMISARDRVIGIPMGNAVIYLEFTQIWTKRAARDARAHIADALTSPARVMRLAPGT